MGDAFKVVVWIAIPVCMAASLVWLLRFTQILFHWNHTTIRLCDQTDEAPESGWPSLSVIFAARNEQAEIEKAARSLLAQDYPRLQLIAVDDRSTDATGSILDQLQAEDTKLTVVHVRELPSGWLGKNHALHMAAQTTDAEWLLFTDADVVFAPQALQRAVAFAEREKLDHLTVIPEMPTDQIGERIFMSVFGLLFALHSPLWLVTNPKRRQHLGIGAFNLVRATAFRAIDGFERIALSVDDDMQLGKSLKWAGFRSCGIRGDSAVSVRWHVGIGGMIRGLEKNFFAGLGYSLFMAAFAIGVLLTLCCGPHVGLFVGPWWSRCICAAGLAAMCFIVRNSMRQSRVGWQYGLLTPLGAIANIVALIRSVWLTMARGGVLWRDHLYRLADLRRHVRERNAWQKQKWKTRAATTLRL